MSEDDLNDEIVLEELEDDEALLFDNIVDVGFVLFVDECITT